MVESLEARMKASTCRPTAAPHPALISGLTLSAVLLLGLGVALREGANRGKWALSDTWVAVGLDRQPGGQK